MSIEGVYILENGKCTRIFQIGPSEARFEDLDGFNPLSASVASYRNQSIDLHSKSIDWFLYEGNTGT